MSKFKTDVEINVTSNLERRLPQLGRSLQNFSRQGAGNLRALGASVNSVSKSIDTMTGRYTTWAAAIGAGASVRYLTNLQRRFTRLGITADISAGQVDKIKKQLFDIARERNIAVPAEELADAIDVIVEKRGDLELATTNMRNIGYAIQASGAAGRDIGAMIADMQEKFGLGNEKDFLLALDTLVVQGKAGAFTLENLATQGNRVSSAMARTGRQGSDAVREMGATLQIFRQGAGSAEQATTAFERTIANLFDKQKQIKKLGVQLFDPEELKKGHQVMRPLSKVLEEIIIKTKGNEAVLGDMFGEEGIRGVSVLARAYRNTGRFDEYEKFLKLQGDGNQLMKDSARAANDAAAQWGRLLTNLQQVADTRLSGPFSAVADAAGALADNDKLFNGVVGGAVGIGGLAFANKGARWGAGLYNSLAQGIGGAGRAVAPGATAAASVADDVLVGSSYTAGLAPASRAGGMASAFGRLKGGSVGKFGRALGPLGMLLSAGAMGGALMSGDSKEIGGTSGSIAGGWAGSVGGAALGTMLMPGAGTAIGGIAGGAIGSFAGGAIGEAIASAIDQKTKPALDELAKPTKDQLQVSMKIDAPAGFNANVTGFNYMGDKSMTFDANLGKVVVR